MWLNFAEMQSFYRFLIVALAVATSMLPSVRAQDCSFSCIDCKLRGACSEDMKQIYIGKCPADQACVVTSEDPGTQCVPYDQSPCNCGEGRIGCDPYHNSLKITCEDGILSNETCPRGQICIGDGVCIDPNAISSGGRDSGSGGQDSGLGGQDLGLGGQDSGSRSLDSGSGGQDSGLGRQDLGSGGTNSGTTKPATCSVDNANTRYPHETDCKKYIQEYDGVRADAGWIQDSIPTLSSSGHATFVQDEEEGNRTLSGGTKSRDEGQTSSKDVSGGTKSRDEGQTSSKDVSGGTKIGDEVLSKLSGNPLHAFHLMKRLTVYWKHIDEGVVRGEWDDVLRALYGEEGTSPPHAPPHAHPQAHPHTPPRAPLPDDGDLQGAAQALVRLQLVYGLNISELAEGNIQGVPSSAGLTSQDCLYLGKHAYNLGLLQQAVDWLWQAWRLAGYENNATVTQEQVASFLNTAVDSLEKANEEAALEEENSHGKNSSIENEFDKENKSDSRETAETMNTPSHDDELPHGFQYYSPYLDEVNFFSLCRGEKVLPPEAEAQLTCHYGGAAGPRAPLPPYLILMPPKVEVQHPGAARLVTFHDVLRHYEIEEIKRLADPILSRAMVQGLEGRGNTVSSTRTSKVAWLDDTRQPLAARLNRRVALLTGLSTDVGAGHAEALQVANYGVGGHYNPHHDYLLVDKSPQELNNIDPRELEMGDRVATFMFYLSDVARGGATAFPRLGVAVPPVRGSAAFWYNLRRSGGRDVHTLHGACPVLLGDKWVSNKWIRERGQFGTRPCGLQP